MSISPQLKEVEKMINRAFRDSLTKMTDEKTKSLTNGISSLYHIMITYVSI